MSYKAPSHPSLRHLGLILALVTLPFTAEARTEISPTYSATLVKREFQNLEQVDGAKLEGIWLVQFLPGDAFQMLLDGQVMVDGFWTIKDDRITLTEMSGPMVCDWEGATEAVYRVSVRGFSLDMETEMDPCPERAAVLSLGAFRAMSR